MGLGEAELAQLVENSFSFSFSGQNEANRAEPRRA
jgi:hypothetical protein